MPATIPSIPLHCGKEFHAIYAHMSVYIYIYICVRTCVYEYIDVLFLATKHGLDVNFWDFRPDLPFFPRIFGNPRHMAKLNAKVDNSWDKRSS